VEARQATLSAEDRLKNSSDCRQLFWLARFLSAATPSFRRGEKNPLVPESSAPTNIELLIGN
jgi:hypothetical protein